MTKQTYTPDNVLLQNSRTGEVPTESATLIIKDMMDQSVITQLAKYEPMNKPKKKFAYLAEGPGAYWVDETERIQTSKPKWLDLEMEAKKLGVILPVSKEYLKWDLPSFFAEMRPKIAEAFQQKFDAAALFGINSPYATGVSIHERAVAAGHVVAPTEDIYDDLNNIMSLVEDGDNEPQAFAATRSINRLLRGAKDTQGRPIFNDARDGATNQVLGLPIAYGNKASWDSDKAKVITGDFDHAFYGILQNIEYAISEDATLTTIQDKDGNPVNLFERDMFALRATMHIGFMTVKDDAFAVLGETAEAGA